LADRAGFGAPSLAVHELAQSAGIESNFFVRPLRFQTFPIV